MSEMVEEVARAIKNARFRVTGRRGNPDDFVVDDQDRIVARAAIAAMREPAVAMAETYWWALACHPDTFTEVWEATIDARPRRLSRRPRLKINPHRYAKG